MSAERTVLEELVVADVRARRDELCDVVARLVALDTTAREPGDPARDEAALQMLLAERLAALGATVDLWEPEPTGKGNRFVPDDLDFVGRPQLAATLPGAGGGRSLLLNGHIDVVGVEPREQWSSDPRVATERDGRLYGRGVNDMKGGIAAMVVALESLQRAGVCLRGDVVLCTVTDEESSGAGGRAAVARGVGADAGLCAEATDFDAWVACRGTVTPTISVEGRAGHAEMPQPHWSDGGAVNAIEKIVPVLEGVRALREDWRTRADHRHPLLAPGDIVPVLIGGGTWIVTYPHSCSLTCDITYLPGHVDEAGTGRRVEDEVARRLQAAVAADPWFTDHPLRIQWSDDVVPAEIPGDHPLVELALEVAHTFGHAGRVAGLDSWHDAASFTRGGTPCFSFGPDGIGSAHAVDECVTIDALVDFCAATAVTAMRWCGVAP